MYQAWRDLLFLHWEFPAADIQKSLPPGLTVDCYDGKAYLGLVPFYMCGIRPRFVPPVPGISNFLEMNVRTYVYDKHGRPGVWFYSLDANQWLAVRLARRFFNLPYFDAHMQARNDDGIDYQVTRKGLPESATHLRYKGGDALPAPEPGSFEYFLVERYFLFAVDRAGTLFSGKVYHSPYPIHSVDYEIMNESALSLAGFDKENRSPDHAIMSPGVHVKVYAIEKEV